MKSKTKLQIAQAYLERIAADATPDEVEFDICGCDESHKWMLLSRKRKALALDALDELKEMNKEC